MKMPSSPCFIDLTGQVLNRITVNEYAGRNAKGHSSVWTCTCECGETLTVRGCALTSGHTKSCGCLHLEQVIMTGALNRTHGNAVHGKISPAYQSWQAMKKRCTNPKASNWNLYGGRGVRVCTRWLNSFEEFLKDVGPRPEGTTLDRVNPNGHYVPSNGRWATAKQQNNNKRKSKGGAVLPFVDVM